MRENDLDLLEMARGRGLITDAQYHEIEAERSRLKGQGRLKSPTRIAIEMGILSDEDSHDLETDAWIRSLPREFDEYRILRLLGRGGMAVVFEAEDTSLGKRVALKLLLPEFATSDAYLARFHREARIAAKLTHPNTVQVFRTGEKERMQYLVMEYVEGETLSAIIRHRRRIPEAEALDIAWQVAGALEEAAGLGIIHRDIKPGNILLSKWEVPKLADFGIAKEFSGIADPMIQASLTMGVVGTPTYMSPEQARGARDLDVRSDIYSLGATLYHMVVGDLPFPLTTPQETMVRVVSESPKPPLEAFPEMSEAAATVICRMMAKDPAERYPSYKELREDLAAARDGEEVSDSYEEVAPLLRPNGRRGEADEDAEEGESSLARILTIAGSIAAAGIAVLWAMKGCE
jgi:serine/threonine-protein kinase